MVEKLVFIISGSILCCLYANANDTLLNTSALKLNDKDSIKISLLPESESPIQVSDADKPILRYGFHRTHDCTNFDKAFICVRKCLDLDYQIAHADKNCVCTCFKNTILAKYKAPKTGHTKWKLGAPTTSLPPWAGKGEQKPDDYEINAKYTEFIEEAATEGSDASKGGDADGVQSANEGVHEADDIHNDAPAAEEAPAEAAPAEGDTATEAPPAEEEAPAAEVAAADGEAAAEVTTADGEAAPEVAPAEGEAAPEQAPAEAEAAPEEAPPAKK